MNTIRKIYSSLIVLVLFVLSSSAQTEQSTPTPNVTKAFHKPAGKNIFKINLTALFLNQYNFQYERVISKRISLVVGYRTMPEGPVPFKQKLIDNSTDPAGAKDAFDALSISNSAITPELRLYTGKKGYGKGFYLAPFYRMATFKASGFNIDFTNAAGNPSSMQLSGELKGNTYGLMMGAQWSLGKHVSLDWHILGAHYGNSNGTLYGRSSVSLTTAEQTDLLNSMKDIDIPLTEERYTVNANGATMEMKGPWAGIRAAIGLGIRL